MPESASDSPSPPTASPPRRRWRRRLLVTLVLLVVLPVILVQSLLWSDLPRRIVERQLSETLGFRVKIGKLRIGWFGSVEIRDLTIRQPDDRQQIEVPHAWLRMTSLPMLPVRQEVHSIHLSGPRIVLAVRDDSLPTRQPDSADPGGPARKAVRVPAFRLPNIWAEHVTLELRLADDRVVEVPNVLFRASQQAGSDRAYFRLESHTLGAMLAGSFVTRDSLQHEVSLAWFDEGSDQIRKQLPEWPIGTVYAEWRGRMDGGGVVGTLEVEHAEIGKGHFSGRVFAWVGQGVTLRPDPVRVDWPGSPAVEVTSPSGEIRFHDGQLVVDGLLLRSDAGMAAIDASADLDRAIGSISLKVRQLTLESIRGELELDGSLSRDRFNRPTVAMRGRFDLQTPDGPLRSDLQLDAAGDELRQLDWTLAGRDTLIQALSNQPVTSWTASGTATLDHSGLLRLSLAKTTIDGVPTIQAVGGLDLSTMTGETAWWLWTRGETLAYDMPRVGPRPLEFDLHVDGTRQRADVRSLWLKIGDGVFRGWGRVGPNAGGPPLQLQLSFQQFTPAWTATLDQPRLLRGAVEGKLTVTGSLAPLDYRVFAQLIGQDVVFADVPVGQVLAMIEGRGNKDRLSIRTHYLDLLSGNWRGELTVPRDATQPIDVMATAERARVRDIARLFGMQGDARGRADLRLRAKLRPEALASSELQGVVELSNLELSPLQADRVVVPFSLVDRRVRVATSASRDRGDIRLTFASSLDDLRQWTLAGHVHQWPLRVPGSEAGLILGSSSEQLTLTLADEGPLLRGKLHAKLDVEHPGFPAGSVTTELAFRRQRVEILQLRGTLLGATLHGRGVADLERFETSELELQLSGLDSAELVAAFPDIEGLAGRFDLAVRLSPPTVLRPTGPLETELRLVPREASYRNIPLGQVRALAHVDRGPDGVPFGRVSIGTIEAELAGGMVRGFARLTRLRRDHELRCLVNLELDGLRLEQLAPAQPEQFGDMSGRLDGRIDSFGDPRQLPTLDLRGRLSISEARLSTIPALSAVFAIANAGPTPPRPSGSAETSFRLEQDRLVVPRLTVFDRGTFIEGYAIELGGLSSWPQTELRGYALASARPLRDVRVPLVSSLLSNVDEVINALQKEVTTIRLGGTIAEPRASQASLAEVYGNLRWLFGK